MYKAIGKPVKGKIAKTNSIMQVVCLTIYCFWRRMLFFCFLNPFKQSWNIMEDAINPKLTKIKSAV